MITTTTLRGLLTGTCAALILAGAVWAASEVRAPELKNREQIVSMLHDGDAGMLIRDGFSAIAHVMVEVDTRGRVGKVKMVRSSGHRIVDRELLQLAKRLSFVPASEDGVPVRAWVTLPFIFGNGTTT